MVGFGGVDAANATGTVLDVLHHCDLPADLRICVVMGSQAPALGAVSNRAARMRHPTDVLVDVENMAALMADADLAIGAAGGTAWERCCLGLPTLLVVLAANQEAGARALQAQGAALLLGEPSSIEQALPKAIQQCGRMDVLSALSAAAAGVTDGIGVARVLERMARCDD